MSLREFDVGDRKLYGLQFDVPEGVKVRGKLLFHHGLNDHVLRHADVLKSYAEKGYQLYSYDQRGQGQSVHNFLDIGSTDTRRIMNDLDEILGVLLEENDAKVPFFLGGHSNGGGITVYYSCVGQYRHQLAGFICIHPWVGPLHKSFRPNSIEMALVNVLGRYLPWVKIPLQIPAERLTENEESRLADNSDKHIMKWVSLGQLEGSMRRAECAVDKSFVSSKFDPSKPILFMAGKRDEVVDYQSVQLAYDVNPSKDKTILLNNGLHEVFRSKPEEIAKFKEQVLEWLDKHT